jgi:flagellar hook-basal body complex protein FliE
MEVGPIQGSALPAQTGTRTESVSGGFADLLGQALGELQSVSDNANAKVSALATGQDVEIHDVMLALEAESLAMSLATNVRNKAVEAYQEVFRMQV